VSAESGGEVAAPVLVLCLPRSHSSVVCAMLGQHPELFGFPELNLFCHETVGEILDEDSASDGRAGVIAGIVRTLVYLGEPAPHEWLRKRAAWPAARVLDELLARVAPRRGVDKSPRTALSSECVERALRHYPHAKLVHLTRHPVPQIESLVRFLARDGRTPPPSFAAHLWSFVTESLLDLEKRLGDEQVTRVRSEDLLSHPLEEGARLARWLGLRDDADALHAMCHPERSAFASPSPAGEGLENDAEFQRRPALRPVELPEHIPLPREWKLDPWLDARVRGMAKRLGYAFDSACTCT